MHVVAYVGDAIEMDEMTIAIVDETDDLFATGTGEVTEEHVGTTVLFEPLLHLGDLAKQGDIVGQTLRGLVVEVSDDTIAGIEAFAHTFVEIGEVMAGTYEKDTTVVASLLAFCLEDGTAEVTTEEEDKEDGCCDTHSEPDAKRSVIVHPEIEAEDERHDKGGLKDTTGHRLNTNEALVCLGRESQDGNSVTDIPQEPPVKGRWLDSKEYETPI